MSNSTIKVEVTGAKEFAEALQRFPREADKYMQQAGDEAVQGILKQEVGLKVYPPATAANRPPTPYYQRGMGMVYASKTVGSSEMYGKAWAVEKQSYGVIVGNDASYAPFLTDDTRQAKAMAKIGWKKLYRVILDKMPQITQTFNLWVNKLLRDTGLN